MDLPLLLFWLKKLLAALVLPPLLPLLLISFGLVLLKNRPRLGQSLAWAGVVLSLLLMLPASVGWMVALIEPPAPLTAQTAAKAQAIVILGAGSRSYAPEFGGETVNRLSLERVRYGARLARTTSLPVLVSGGGSDETPEATLMKTTLEEDFGVAVRWTEERSRDTRENARESAAILKAAEVENILLVTHAMHMPRAQAEFEAAGLVVHPAPTAWLGNWDEDARTGFLLGELPNPNSAYAGWFALHEALGQLAYRLSR